MAIKLGGGSAGADINEYRFYPDRGDVWTDSNGFVWMKKGARTLDVTTYPDAYAEDSAVSRTSDYQSDNYTGDGPMDISSDGAWAIVAHSGYSTSYRQTNIATDTTTAQTAFPSSGSHYATMGLAYIKCNASNQSSITNANNYFVIRSEVTPSNTSDMRLRMYSLVGGSGTDAGKPYQYMNDTALRDTSGNKLYSQYGYGAAYGVGELHWDPSSRKLYFLARTSANCHLFVYNWNGAGFGYNNYNAPSSTNNATTQIDWKTQAGNNASTINKMSGDATHLYVGYSASGGTKIRKIPKSGNLSWSSGTDLGFVKVSGDTGANVLVDYSTYFSKEGMSYPPSYYKTVNSVTKFMAGTNSSGSKRLREFALDIPVIGEDSPDYRAAKTQYQRIK
jgi:hypothetical protein